MLKNKIMAAALSGVMAITPIIAAAPVLADEQDPGIEVVFTVCDQGTFALEKSGGAAVNLVVDVEDTNNDGAYSYDEALTALHNEFYKGGAEAGYAVSNGYVNKIWGVETSNCSFFTNNEAISTGVTASEVKDGDKLYAAILSDSEAYSDVYTTFNTDYVEAYTGVETELTLTGYPAMSGGDYTAIEGAEIGIFKDGKFESLDLTTDENGKVKVTFEEEGVYLVTAKGSVETVENLEPLWLLMETTYSDLSGKKYYGKMDWTTGDCYIAYTEADYGDGPYPYSELQWIKNGQLIPSTFTGHAAYSGNVIIDAPIIAPVCTIYVNKYIHFDDVEEGSYYEEPVYWAAYNGITTGTGSMFYPNNTCTRAEFVTFLWRENDCPVVDYACPFTDVQKGSHRRSA